MSKFAFLTSFLICVVVGPSIAGAETQGERLSQAALERTKHPVTYDGAYQRIAYPGGDVDPGRGVCSDVVVRSYRGLGIDLQVLLHEDMKREFSAYPTFWGLSRPDSNIDHRRVPNLRRFFERHGTALPITATKENFLPGDLVTWNLISRGSLPHIGIVTDRKSPEGVPLIAHNVGRGPQLEDVLFSWTMTGHYRYPAINSDS